MVMIVWVWAGRQLKGDVKCFIVEVPGISLLCQMKGFSESSIASKSNLSVSWHLLTHKKCLYSYVAVTFMSRQFLGGRLTWICCLSFFLDEGAPFQAH